MQFFTDFLAGGEGLGAIALATGDANGAHAELSADGIATDAPLDFSRPVEQLGDAKFRILQLPPERTPGCRMFLCQHFTRELVWRPEFQHHPIGVTGVAGIAVIALDASGYASVLAERPKQIDEGVRLETGSAPIAVCEEAALRKRLAGATLPARSRPVVAALFLRVAHRARAFAALRSAGFAPVQLRDGSCAIGAGEAHGVALVFG
jgi:hypothetical protein